MNDRYGTKTAQNLHKRFTILLGNNLALETTAASHMEYGGSTLCTTHCKVLVSWGHHLASPNDNASKLKIMRKDNLALLARARVEMCELS